ncbi:MULTISPECIES: c-type cytochrome [Rhodanobacter]|jgi:nitric oxide reductase subunit C|uniref:C-type cytochrome n=1 Tax=Rhodanobacter ginsenosidimutans TaxID=490571 RepID=A0ABW0JSC1_9GAMM|nr:c-type cytochrome [Rhodanobacter sp. Root627]KRA33472.1 cytochrome C [Rhodanobacter sp. Root627]
MNKRQTRLFAIVGTLLVGLLFLGMTFDTLRQIPKLSNAQDISPEVTLGNKVWHENNCINCHTLFGEGAYYAPDLTKITQLRGEAYLRAYMHDPSKFYDEQKVRRLMPTQNLSDADITGLIAFLDWVSKVDNQGWPPRPLLVSGSSLPGMAAVAPAAADKATGAPGTQATTQADSPIAQGETLFHGASPPCGACHSTAPGVDMAGPSLAGISALAEKAIASGAYKGEAKDAAGFIRESILHPSKYLEPGDMYSAGGTSFMPDTYAQSLTPEQVDHLVAYLSTLK